MEVLARHDQSISDYIRTVACDLFCRDGYNGTGMRGLAAAVGIQPGSLYNHIDSKQTLLYELVSDYESHLVLLYTHKSLARCRTASACITLLWESIEQYVIDNSSLSRVARSEKGNLTEAQACAIARFAERRVLALRTMLCKFARDVGLSEEGAYELADELHRLLECNTSLLLASPRADTSFVRRQLRAMAMMLLIKRD
ncbi:TetR/AcrR family transcriptional regulator [Pseudomonas sp. NFX224]|uniref:TetR/AcrR family transcriptional regulator n=1 Tax=Pseudomonas sp. NFX224 TaxID=3402862 RepID=UPI003AFA6829